MSVMASPAFQFVAQLFIQVQIKENIKIPCHWLLWGYPRANGNAENVYIWWRHHDIRDKYIDHFLWICSRWMLHDLSDD